MLLEENDPSGDIVALFLGDSGGSGATSAVPKLWMDPVSVVF